MEFLLWIQLTEAATNSAKVFDFNFRSLNCPIWSELIFLSKTRKRKKIIKSEKTRNIIAFIADVQFNITFAGTVEEYPNYMGFMSFDFNDTETLTRLVNFQNGFFGQFHELQLHTYKSYGTYYPKLVLTNNITEEEHDFLIEVEQCIRDFSIGLTTPAYEENLLDTHFLFIWKFQSNLLSGK